MEVFSMDFKKYIADVKDFPKPDILFRDITPLMQDGFVYQSACDEMIKFAKEKNAEVIVGPEARGFIFGCPVSYALGIGFVPIRKLNKLPREVVSVSYDLEYGSSTLCIHKDAIKPGQRVLIVDDLLATGGTVKATIELVEKLGGIVCGLTFLIELAALEGRKKLIDKDILTLIEY